MPTPPIEADPPVDAAVESWPKPTIDADTPVTREAVLKQFEGVDLLFPGESPSTIAPPEPPSAPVGDPTPVAPASPEAPVEPEVEIGGFEEDAVVEETQEGFDTAAFDKETESQASGLDPKQGDAWRKLRNQLKEERVRAQSATIQSERVRELEAKAAKVEELQSMVEELSAADYSIKVQASQEYRDKVSVPAQRIKDLAAEISTTFEGVTAEEVLDAIREPSLKTRAELIDNLVEKGVPELAIHEIRQGSYTYREMKADHERMLANAETEWKQVQKQREESELRLKESQRAAVKRHMDEQWDGFEQLLGKEAVAEARRKSALLDIRESTEKNLAHAQVSGWVAPILLKELKNARRQLADATDQIRKLKGAAPSLADGTGHEAEGEPKGPRTIMEASRMFGDLR